MPNSFRAAALVRSGFYECIYESSEFHHAILWSPIAMLRHISMGFSHGLDIGELLVGSTSILPV